MLERVDYKNIDMFGKHGDIKSLVRMELPFEMFLSWNHEVTVKSQLVHPYIKDELEEALNEIHEYYGEEGIARHRLNEWGGCFNDRYSRSSGRWSVHAWGLAVDYLPSLGQYGAPAITPKVVVDCFEDHGFAWGGWWEYPDGMHFSAINE